MSDTSTSNGRTGPRPGHNQRLGAIGEELAASWYRRRGYRIVDRNWRTRNGELDLIVARPRELVICEVKTRTSRRYGHPLEAVNATKQARIRRLALAYVAATGARGRLRFDIACVEQGEVEVWQAAF